MRKTIDRDKIVAAANAKLRANEEEYPYMNKLYREHIGRFVINLLLEVEAYKGFLYLESHHMDNDNEKPGIRRDAEGRLKLVDVDETRIQIL